MTQTTSPTMCPMCCQTLHTMCTKRGACQSPSCAVTCGQCGCRTSTQPACSVCKAGPLMSAYLSSSPTLSSFTPSTQIYQTWKFQPGAAVPRSLSSGIWPPWRVIGCQSSCTSGSTLPLATRWVRGGLSYKVGVRGFELQGGCEGF